MLVWADGFDHYGTTPNGGRDAMLAGAWASFIYGTGTAPYISNTQVRSGTRSLRFEFNNLATFEVLARRVIGAAHTVTGFGLGVYFDSLPTTNKTHGVALRNNSNQDIVMITVESDGAIGAYKGSGHTAVASSDPVIVANSWQYIEVRTVTDSVVGEIEVRVNERTVLSLTGLDLGSLAPTQIVYGMPGGKFGASMNWQIDDLVVWNDDGTENNDFMGPVRVELLLPDADTAETDWVRNTGSSDFSAINNIPPDGDTTYITGANNGDVSEFTLQDSPSETFNVRAVYIPMMGKLIAAGTGNVQVSLVSGSDVSLGPDQGLTTSYSYWGGVHELDPATDLPWTKAGLDAVILRVEKTL